MVSIKTNKQTKTPQNCKKKKVCMCMDLLEEGLHNDGNWLSKPEVHSADSQEGEIAADRKGRKKEQRRVIPDLAVACSL